MTNGPHMLIWALTSLGMCFGLPLAAIIAWAVIASKKARLRHDERLAMIEKGMAPDGATSRTFDAPPIAVRAEIRAERAIRRRDPARRIGWAVGLLVGGVMWMLADQLSPGIVLTAFGASFLTRGIIGMRREPASTGEPQ